MKRLMMVCLCLLVVNSCAFAQESVNLGGEGCDQMKYVCTLPDGRIVFCGNRGTVGNYNDCRARLLCMNPDWTVSWEYTDPAEGMARYAFGALLEDGNIGVIYYNAPYQNTTALEIRKFTAEGQPVGKPVDLFQRSDDIPNIVNSRWFIQTLYSEDGKAVKAFLDWNGYVLFSVPTGQGFWIMSAMAADDGFVLAGSESVSGGFAKIMKIDLSENPVWETVLPLMSTSSQGARIQKCIRTSDGGYLGWVAENRTDLNKWCYGLVRLNENGRVLWINQDSFANRSNMMCQDLIEYDGKFVFLENPDFSDVSEKVPRVYYWFDADGKELGRTELWIPREDIRGITGNENASISDGNMLTTENGLWSLYSVRISNDKDIRKEMDSLDAILYRVPEPD